MLPDAPKSLGNAAERAARVALLSEAHVQPLTALVHRLRLLPEAHIGVPFFDPLDGGTRAECLFLLEAPGGKAVGSGFVSRNNPDETAKNFFLLNQEAGLARQRTATWNVVPWYVGSGTRIRPATRRDLIAAKPYLFELLNLMPRLRVVVLLGKKAQRCREYLEKSWPDRTIFTCPHPSPRVLNGRPYRRKEILDCFENVVAYLEELKSSATE